MGKWVLVDRCKKCNHTLVSHEIAYSQGVCPYCGTLSPETCVGPYGHRLIDRVQVIEYRPSLLERLKLLVGRN